MTADADACLPHAVSLTEAAAHLRDSVPAQALASACLARLEQPGPAFKGFVRIHKDQALQQAAMLDRLQGEGQPCGPLHGVPLAHKDMFFQEGELAE